MIWFLQQFPSNVERKMMRSLVLILLLTLGAPVVSWASTMSLNDPVFGSDSITLDTSTSLEWLDVTLSINRSYNDVSTQFSIGGDFEEWGYATQVDFHALISNFFGIFYSGGVSTAAPFGSTDSQIVEDFINLFGDTGQFEPGTFQLQLQVGHTFGILADSTDLGISRKLGLVYDWEGNGFDDIDRLQDTGNIESAFASFNVGSFLIRPHIAPIPEPSTMLLMGSGLLVMGLYVWRRERLQLS